MDFFDKSQLPEVRIKIELPVIKAYVKTCSPCIFEPTKCDCINSDNKRYSLQTNAFDTVHCQSAHTVLSQIRRPILLRPVDALCYKPSLLCP